MIAVEDFGRGIAAERLRDIAHNLFRSAKAGDERTLGEKAIGLLAFQQIGARMDIVTCPRGTNTTLALRLRRGSAEAELVTNEKRRARRWAGTTVYIYDLDPEVGRMLTLNKIVTYLRRRRGVALKRGDYAIEVVEGRRRVTVTPDEPDGVRLALPALTTPAGKVEFHLHVSLRSQGRRRIALVGAGGTTVVDDVTELEELDREPWTSEYLAGYIVCEALEQTAGRRAVVRDRFAFPAFLQAVRTVEPAVTRTLEQVAAGGRGRWARAGAAP